jgi:serine/threonine-protein kinase
MARPFIPDDDATTGGLRNTSSDPIDSALEMDIAAAREDSPGGVLAGRYELLRLISAGGMGMVYEALDRELAQVVALKVIKPEITGGAQMVRRFNRELILARQVTHPNFIRIFDLGVAEGHTFLTMEFIDGEDLGTILARRGKLPAAEAASVISQVAKGLGAAHLVGIIHRNLNLQNIMIDGAGKATVMDFGIALSMDASNLTRTGASMGPLAYISPEQLQGAPIDARSDLFSLGVIFYELLTGHPPFQADSRIAALKLIQEVPVPPAKAEPLVPRRLSDIVMRMLATQPEDRYQTAAVFLRDLEGWEKRQILSRSGMFGRWAVKFADRAGWLSMVDQQILDAFYERRRVGSITHSRP